MFFALSLYFVKKSYIIKLCRQEKTETKTKISFSFRFRLKHQNTRGQLCIFSVLFMQDSGLV